MKKTVVILISFLFTAASAAPTVTAESRLLKGDSNGDGLVSISDVTAIQRHSASLDVLGETRHRAADVNGDGAVDIADATLIQRYLAEFENPYGIGSQMENAQPTTQAFTRDPYELPFIPSP